MNGRRLLKVFGLFCLVLAVTLSAILVWYANLPGPMDFAEGKTVPLGEYAFTPTGVPADSGAEDEISRGKYLTVAADCLACHTVKGGAAFAGGRPFPTPFGTLYSSNITPDQLTGIGRWTNSDFLTAVHKGVGPGGKHLYPAFPYAAYTYLTDQDVLAIKSYLFTLAPVSSVAPQNKLAFPFNQRWLMFFWSELFNPNIRFRPNPTQTVDWNRGAYLVEALAHCGECHTPRTLAQSLDNKAKFTGALSDGWRAYNITQDRVAGVGMWTAQELSSYLSNGFAVGHGTASGPMGEAVDISLSRLSPTDIAAIGVYLRSVPPDRSKDGPISKAGTAPSAPMTSLYSGTQEQGHQLFAGACVGCHRWSGNNPHWAQASFSGTSSLNDPTAINVTQVILHGSGRASETAIVRMPAFETAFTDSEVAALANYVTKRFGSSPSSITAEDVGKLRSQN